jgi:nucleoid-associated protein YgaU
MPAESVQTVTHVVKEGETLSSIAFEYLGRKGRWKEVFWQNARALTEIRPIPRLVNPDFIKPGDKLVIMTGIVLREKD